MEQTNKIEYAGFWRRAFAISIDTILYMIVSFIFSYLIIKIFSAIEGSSYTYGMYARNDLPSLLMYSLQILNALLYLLIVSYFLTSKWQATPGKRIMNAYVADVNISPLSTKRAAFRTALPFVLSLLVFIFIIPSSPFWE